VEFTLVGEALGRKLGCADGEAVEFRRHVIRCDRPPRSVFRASEGAPTSCSVVVEAAIM
jgi:hypothetical protein